VGKSSPREAETNRVRAALVTSYLKSINVLLPGAEISPVQALKLELLFTAQDWDMDLTLRIAHDILRAGDVSLAG
jgi:hypothetical protein